MLGIEHRSASFSSIAARLFRVAIEVRLIAGLIFKVPPAQPASAVNYRQSRAPGSCELRNQ